MSYPRHKGRPYLKKEITKAGFFPSWQIADRHQKKNLWYVATGTCGQVSNLKEGTTVKTESSYRNQEILTSKVISKTISPPPAQFSSILDPS
jgi:hypothetical protein